MKISIVLVTMFYSLLLLAHGGGGAGDGHADHSGGEAGMHAPDTRVNIAGSGHQAGDADSASHASGQDRMANNHNHANEKETSGKDKGETSRGDQKDQGGKSSQMDVDIGDADHGDGLGNKEAGNSDILTSTTGNQGRGNDIDSGTNAASSNDDLDNGQGKERGDVFGGRNNELADGRGGRINAGKGEGLDSHSSAYGSNLDSGHGATLKGGHGDGFSLSSTNQMGIKGRGIGVKK